MPGFSVKLPGLSAVNTVCRAIPANLCQVWLLSSCDARKPPSFDSHDPAGAEADHCRGAGRGVRCISADDLSRYRSFERGWHPGLEREGCRGRLSAAGWLFNETERPFRERGLGVVPGGP